MEILKFFLCATWNFSFGFATKGKDDRKDSISVSQTAIIRFENSKMVEVWEDFDALGMFQQLGMELKPKEGEK